jgi:tetratricopeptide (TPR) repeat protein
MNEAIILNNNALLYLQMGNAFEACNLLTKASGLYLQMTDSGHRGNRHRTKHTEHQISWINLSAENNRGCSRRDNNECGSHPGLYNSGLTVAKCCCQKKYSTEDARCVSCMDDSCMCPCVLSPVIWYNLGLTCQILGTEVGGSTTQEGIFYLSRSRYLYDKVVNICSKGLVQETKGLSTLLMAALNNQACISYEMGSYEEYYTAMRRLRCTLHSTYGAARRPAWAVFYTNTLMLECSTPTTAGAA